MRWILKLLLESSTRHATHILQIKSDSHHETVQFCKEGHRKSWSQAWHQCGRDVQSFHGEERGIVLNSDTSTYKILRLICLCDEV